MHELPFLRVLGIPVWSGVAVFQAAVKLKALARDVRRGAFHLSGHDQYGARVTGHTVMLALNRERRNHLR